MTAVADGALTAADVLATVRSLGPRLAARAAEIESARELPADLLDDLRAAGAFRLLLPSSHGGLEAPLPAAVDVFAELASADASTAWTVMIGAGAWIDLTGLPRATFDVIYADGPDVIVAGVINPATTTSGLSA